MSYNDNEALQQQEESYELYKFWTDDAEWFFTSYSKDVVLDGDTYTHVAIKRTGYIKELSPTVPTINITAPISQPFSNYLVATPLLPINIMIRRYYSDGTNNLIFLGKVKNISYQSNYATVTCVFRSNELKNIFPRTKYQSYCNNNLYDDVCGVDKPTWTKVGCTITKIEGIRLYSLAFALDPAYGNFKNGFAEFGNDKRFISSHDTSIKAIDLQFGFDGIQVGDTVDLVRGCDKSPGECKNTFSNFSQYVGFPYMPFDNPVLG